MRRMPALHVLMDRGWRGACTGEQWVCECVCVDGRKRQNQKGADGHKPEGYQTAPKQSALCCASASPVSCMTCPISSAWTGRRIEEHGRGRACIFIHRPTPALMPLSPPPTRRLHLHCMRNASFAYCRASPELNLQHTPGFIHDALFPGPSHLIAVT